MSRLVVLLTPVFAALSGYVATEALELPGAPQLDKGQMTAVFVAGATAGAGAAVKWLHGLSLWERQKDNYAQAMEIDRVQRAEDPAARVLAELQELDKQFEHLVDVVEGYSVGVNALTERVDEIERTVAEPKAVTIAGREYLPIPDDRIGVHGGARE